MATVRELRRQNGRRPAARRRGVPHLHARRRTGTLRAALRCRGHQQGTRSLRGLVAGLRPGSGGLGHGLHRPRFGGASGLAAWQSLAALVGCPEGAGAAEVEARVTACAWHGFDAGTKWFEQVAWDIGLAVLSPDGRRLAVLAATDTD
ncbi:DUF6183 family protein [Streptomyces sp. NPDC127066]|uniref:DUF6183 family protein n=1 Tax=Streptomyces sp. NPDC127066 TaxID=3347125 RepID=UPI003660D113